MLDNMQQLEENISYLPGDCLIAAAFLSYAGPFLSQYRDELVQNTWLKMVWCDYLSLVTIYVANITSVYCIIIVVHCLPHLQECCCFVYFTFTSINSVGSLLQYILYIVNVIMLCTMLTLFPLVCVCVSVCGIFVWCVYVCVGRWVGILLRY